MVYICMFTARVLVLSLLSQIEINNTKLFYTGVFGNFRLVGDAGDLSVLISGSVYHCYHKKYIIYIFLIWLVWLEKK